MKADIKNQVVVCIDIDDTLAIWHSGVEGPYYEKNYKLIDEIKKHAARGHFLIAWSAGGYEWARRIVDEFELQDYFGLVMTKPAFMWDDRNPVDWTRVCYVK